MENYKTFYENTIIDNIDFEPYELSNDMYLYDKIKTLFNIFKNEYVHKYNKHISLNILFRDWLQGLPTVITIPFSNYDILNNAKLYGFDIYTEDKEGAFLEDYWLNCSNAFFTLKDNL